MTLSRNTAICAVAVLLAACSSTAPPASTTAATPAASTSATPATSATRSAAPAVNAVDPAAVQVLKDMGTYLQSLQRFEVSVDLSGERVLADGQKLTHSATADLAVARPNRIYSHTSTDTTQRNLYYDGKKIALAFPGSNYYSTVDYSGTLAELVTNLRSRYGVDLPAADLFVWGTPAAPFTDLQSAMNAGQAVVDGRVADHYAYRQPGLDWQLWVTPGANPLPLKLVVTNMGDDARPQSTTYFQWNVKPTFKDSRFTYVPPRGAQAIDLVALKNK